MNPDQSLGRERDGSHGTHICEIIGFTRSDKLERAKPKRGDRSDSRAISFVNRGNRINQLTIIGRLIQRIYVANPRNEMIAHLDQTATATVANSIIVGILSNQEWILKEKEKIVIIT